MDIGFIWDEDKYRDVQRRHNIRFYEVVSAFEDPLGYDDADPQGHPDRWLYVGQAVTNRVLAIIYTPEGEEFHRLITAYEAEGEILNEYYRGS